MCTGRKKESSIHTRPVPHFPQRTEPLCLAPIRCGPRRRPGACAVAQCDIRGVHSPTLGPPQRCPLFRCRSLTLPASRERTRNLACTCGSGGRPCFSMTVLWELDLTLQTHGKAVSKRHQQALCLLRRCHLGHQGVLTHGLKCLWAGDFPGNRVADKRVCSPLMYAPRFTGPASVSLSCSLRRTPATSVGRKAKNLSDR